MEGKICSGIIVGDIHLKRTCQRRIQGSPVNNNFARLNEFSLKYNKLARKLKKHNIPIKYLKDTIDSFSQVILNEGFL